MGSVMTYRPAKAYLFLSALKNNLQRVQTAAPNSKVLAIIKANGYGHGMERVAHQLSTADAFGVASIDEAIALRQKGFLHRILLLEGLFSEAEIPEVIQNRLDIVVHSHHQLNWLLNNHFSSQLNVWVKVDTGMHRLGFDPSELTSVITKLSVSENDFCIQIMSHFASADEVSDEAKTFTHKQIDTFNQCCSEFKYGKSLANSAGIICYPQSHFDWVRPGITLYGGGSIPGIENKSEAVMQLESEIISIKTVSEGEAVGYGNTWVAQQKSLIGVVAIGYGDGYPRHAQTGTPVLINGERVSLVGRVSMDMITVDLTNMKTPPQIGDCAVLWGKELSIDEIAHHSSTISYELLCSITKRVQMIEVN